MRVIVAGGAGFVGRHVVRRLQSEEAAEVLTIDRRLPVEQLPGEEVILADLDRAADVERAVRACGGVDALVWLAATIGQSGTVDDSAHEDVRVMVEAPLQLVRGLDPAPAALVYLSSIEVYGRPRYLPVDEDHPTEPFTAYGVAKLCAEQYVAIAGALRGTAVALLRIAFIYGPGQHDTNVIPRFIAAARRGEAPVVHGTGDDIRDDVHVRDVADAVVAALRHRASGAFNIASGQPHTLLDVARAVCRLEGGTLVPRHVEGVNGWVDRWYGIERARSSFGFAPAVDFEGGLSEMWNEAVGP